MATHTCLRAIGDEYCVFHPGEKLVYECTYCDGQLTCMKCVTTFHQCHAMVGIKENVNEKIVQINSFIQRTNEQTLPKLEKEIKHTISKLEENEQKYQNKVMEVRKQDKYLKELVEVYTETKISRLEFLLKETRDMLEKRRTYLNKLQQDLMKDIKDYEQTVKSGSEVYIHDTQAQILRRPTVEIPQQLPVETTFKFTPCKDPKEYIEKAFGVFREVKPDRQSAQVLSKYRSFDQPTTVLELSTSYMFSMNGIYCTPGNNTWIIDTNGKLYCIDRTGKEEKLKQPDVDLFNICTHPITGELFCITTSEKSIRSVISGSGTTRLMFNTEAEPYEIGCTADNHIVLFMKDGTIRKFSSDGKILGIYNYSGSPWIPSISTCSKTNTIALVYGSTVTVLNDSLEEIYQYKGHDKQRFTTASFDGKYLLVGDYNNKNILVLDEDTLVQTIHTKEMSKVAALSVQQDGVLYVGCNDPCKFLNIRYTE